MVHGFSQRDGIYVRLHIRFDEAVIRRGVRIIIRFKNYPAIQYRTLNGTLVVWYQ